MDTSKTQLAEIFERKLEDKKNWRTLEQYAASYLRDTWSKGPSAISMPPADGTRAAFGAGAVHQTEWCLARLYLTLPQEEFASFHILFEKWLQQGDNHVAKQWAVDVQSARFEGVLKAVTSEKTR